MLYSIGHSTFSQPDFLSMLGGQIETVIDVRSHPTSKWPQFWREELEKWLPDSGVNYEWLPALGGWDKRHEYLAPEFEKYGVNLHVYATGKFPKHHIGKDFPDAVDSSQLNLPNIRPKWSNIGLFDYSFFEMLPEFLEGCDRLIERGKTENIAFMCSECLWYRCHRSMICDYLSFRGVETQHIQPRMRQKNKIKFVDGHRLLPHSKVLGNRLERYEPVILEKWRNWEH